MGRKDETTMMVDAAIGHKIVKLRIARGLSRQQLAAKIGVTHQQLQKYEKGTNRITAGRLYLIAKAFGKSMGSFFDEVETEEQLSSQHQRMALEVSRNFMKIKNPANQVAVNTLIRTLAGNL